MKKRIFFKIVLLLISFIASIQLTALQTATQAGRRGFTQVGRYGLERGLAGVRPTVPTMTPARGFIAPRMTALSESQYYRKSIAQDVRADLDYLLTYGKPYEILSTLYNLRSQYGSDWIAALPFETLQNLNNFLSIHNPKSDLMPIVQHAYDQAQLAQTAELAELVGVPEYQELTPELKAAIVSRLPISRERALVPYKARGLAEVSELAKPALPQAEISSASWNAIKALLAAVTIGSLVNYLREQYAKEEETGEVLSAQAVEKIDPIKKYLENFGNYDPVMKELSVQLKTPQERKQWLEYYKKAADKWITETKPGHQFIVNELGAFSMLEILGGAERKFVDFSKIEKKAPKVILSAGYHVFDLRKELFAKIVLAQQNKVLSLEELRRRLPKIIKQFAPEIAALEIQLVQSNQPIDTFVKNNFKDTELLKREIENYLNSTSMKVDYWLTRVRYGKDEADSSQEIAIIAKFPLSLISIINNYQWQFRLRRAD